MTSHRKSTDELIDEGVKETFPASDPVSVATQSETAYEREKRGAPPAVHQPLPKRSPDWMFDKHQ
jgi:hypothetical protein